MVKSFEEQLKAENERFIKAYAQKDAEASAITYAEDARVVWSGTVRRGKKAIVDTFRQNFDSGDKILDFETVACASEGNVAWSSQIWNFSRGKVHLTSGWKKNSAGEWRVQTETSVALKG